MTAFLDLFNYFASVLLVLFGIYAMIAELNLVRKIIGMVILQTGVILFYISVAVKKGGAIPIIAHHAEHGALDLAHYVNPLPHALMLTAIVVGVSTLGVALSLLVSIYRGHGSLEEDEILANLERPE